MKKIFRSPLLLIITAAVVIAAGTAFYLRYDREKPPQYRTQAVEKGDVSQTVSANGTINPVTLVSVGTQVSGTVKKLYVDFNSKVNKGQILLKLDDSLLAAQVRQSEASVQSAQASLNLANANEKRTRDLFALEYVSKQDLDTAVQAQKAAAAALISADAQLEKDRAYLAYSVIRSPVSGVVVDREVDVGQTVAASLQTPTLFKIAQDLSKMQIDTNFAEADIGNIRVGQTVRFTVDAFENQHFNGVVKQLRLNPTTVSNVVTYDVVVNVNNPEKILLPGMTAYVNIVVAEHSDALLVPNAALRFKPSADESVVSPAGSASETKKNIAGNVGGSRGAKSGGAKPSAGSMRDTFPGKVFVLANGKLKLVSVTSGITDNRNTEIVSGDLKQGDQVVIGEVQTADQSSSSGSRPMRLF
ncbi:MAG TPA: efflux RND transporter periplasmic adaptor subunit [Gallionella sp.]|nr:efflux RND transporter periplasmic adaptor subunit [Gallionella sp.]